MSQIKLSHRIALIATALCLTVGGFLVSVVVSNLRAVDSQSILTPPPTVDGVPRAIDGVLVDSDQTNLPLVAVMIENHPDARPQAGLAQSKVVYEILTEGSITRMLALYDLTENLEHIGPVRSARPYYIDLAREYRALYVHSGGSPAALKRLQTEAEIVDLNEFFGRNSHYFWRRDGLYPPHDLYTSSARLAEAAADYQLASSTLVSWQFKDDADSTTRPASTTEIVINYSQSLLSRVAWHYDPGSNSYQRWQSGEVHRDEDGTALSAKNIVIQTVDTEILDDIGRKAMDLIGSGKAMIFQDGQVITGKWERLSLDSRTRYYDEGGTEISFNRGQTRVEVVAE